MSDNKNTSAAEMQPQNLNAVDNAEELYDIVQNCPAEKTDAEEAGAACQTVQSTSRTVVPEAGVSLVPDASISLRVRDDDDNQECRFFSSVPSLFHAYSMTRIGGRTENQDSYIVRQTPYGILFLVCDGMGGQAGGKTASEMACNTILSTVNSEELAGHNIDDILDWALEAANYSIRQFAASHPLLQGMGTTCALLLLNRGMASVRYVGDSRVYLLRKGRKLYRTTDHSLVYDLLERHAIKNEEEARTSAESNVITSALGTFPKIPKVGKASLSYKKGDRFFMSTDGVHGVLPENILLEMVSKNIDCRDKDSSLQSIIQDLADRLDSRGRSMGNHHDNMTALLIDMDADSQKQAKWGERMMCQLKIFIKRLNR